LIKVITYQFEIIIQKILIELGENCQRHRFLPGSSRFESGIFCQRNEKNMAKTAERRKAEKGLDSVDMTYEVCYTPCKE